MAKALPSSSTKLSRTRATRSGSRMPGGAASISRVTSPNIEAFVPMASEKVKITPATSIGSRPSERSAYRSSRRSPSINWVRRPFIDELPLAPTRDRLSNEHHRSAWCRSEVRRWISQHECPDHAIGTDDPHIVHPRAAAAVRLLPYQAGGRRRELPVRNGAAVGMHSCAGVRAVDNRESKRDLATSKWHRAGSAPKSGIRELRITGDCTFRWLNVTARCSRSRDLRRSARRKGKNERTDREHRGDESPHKIL